MVDLETSASYVRYVGLLPVIIDAQAGCTDLMADRLL